MCYYCRMQEHGFCETPKDPADTVGSFSCCCNGKQEAVIIESGEKRPVGRPQLEGSEMTNVLAAGRRRAARLLAEYKGKTCWWKGLSYAGGGVIPLVGCESGVVEAVHHGPDKSVLNNEERVNIHAICTKCHNRWHVLNDPFYGKRPEDGEPFLPIDKEAIPHDPVTLSNEKQLALHDAWWAMPKETRRDYGRIRD